MDWVSNFQVENSWYRKQVKTEVHNGVAYKETVLYTHMHNRTKYM